MNAQNIAHHGPATGATVRDIRSAPGYAAHAVGIEAVGARLTATSAGWSTTPGSLVEVAPTRRASLGERLMERKLVQWTVAYVAAASWILQLMNALGESWSWAYPVQQSVSMVLGMGVVPAVVVAWYHGEKGRQKVCTAECAMVAASVLASVGLVWTVCLGKAF